MHWLAEPEPEEASLHPSAEVSADSRNRPLDDWFVLYRTRHEHLVQRREAKERETVGMVGREASVQIAGLVAS